MSTGTRDQVSVGLRATRDRWVAVGASDQSHSRAAGREAAQAAMARGDAALILAFASPRHHLGELLAGVRDVTGGVPLIGCSTAGEISVQGPGDGTLAVMAIGGPGFTVETAAATGISPRLRQAGAEVAACVEKVGDRPHRALLLLSDGLAGDQQELLRGAYQVAGAAVPMVGGTAGDDLAMRSTRQLHGDHVLENAVVAAAIGSDAPLGVGVRHSWTPFGEPMLVTSGNGERIETLDDEPALDVYLGRLEAPPDCYRDADAFIRFAIVHPLGVSRRSGDGLRCVSGADFEARALGCTSRIPHGAVVSFMECAPEAVLQAAGQAVADALRPLHGLPPLGLLAFDSVGRRRILGDTGAREEVSRMLEAGHPETPLAGLYTYGEIARVRGSNGFHNQALVALAIG